MKSNVRIMFARFSSLGILILLLKFRVLKWNTNGPFLSHWHEFFGDALSVRLDSKIEMASEKLGDGDIVCLSLRRGAFQVCKRLAIRTDFCC